MTNVDHDSLRDLLRHAKPRPAPPAEVAETARAVIRSEWQTTVRQRQRSRNLVRYAVAATILMGVIAVFNLLRITALPPVQVASIDRSFGSVYVLGEQAELRETGSMDAIMAGQTIVTSREAGLAVAWGGGGSLRLDQNTRVEFTDTEAIFLKEGRVYFDSRGATLAAVTDAGDPPALRLRTLRGEVQHVGTQYMAQIDGDALVVSVREGEVTIEGDYFDHRASRGEQVILSGRQRPMVLSIAASGAEWKWLEDTTPVVEIGGHSLYEFLGWVSREMGLGLVFRGDAEAVAREAILRGEIDARPADALRVRLASAALSWRIEEGVIYVGDDS